MLGRGQAVDLVVPLKPLRVAKSRLRGAADDGAGRDAPHAALALALARDTVAAASAAAGVRNLLVVCADPAVTAEFAAVGVEVVPDRPAPGGGLPGVSGLNAAYAHGAGLLRARDAGAVVGALQADLPALRPGELDGAIRAALAIFAAGVAARAFCPDADGSGTTLLLAAPPGALDPRFGPGSAGRHRADGAWRLPGRWPGLRPDVDTPADLRAAAALGLGSHTAAVLAPAGAADRRRA